MRHQAGTSPIIRHGFLLAVAALIAVDAAGEILSSSIATISACTAILVFGLPHGALDLELIKRRGMVGSVRSASVLTLYLGLAAGMYALWTLAPVAALIAFLGIAVVHFAEDWLDTRSPFLALWIAAALLTAPTFRHATDMNALFVALSGRADAEVVTDFMILLAPAGLLIAAAAMLHLWKSGHRRQATSGVIALAGMALLPPAVGFAAFFCLFHSPRHLSDALALLPKARFKHRWSIVMALTSAALGLAAWLFTQQVRADVSAQLVAASFMTLSLLTVPHMAVPAILAALSRWKRTPFAASALGLSADATTGR